VALTVFAFLIGAVSIPFERPASRSSSGKIGLPAAVCLANASALTPLATSSPSDRFPWQLPLRSILIVFPS